MERAFVHVDYQRRDQPEHRTERLLLGLPVIQEADELAVVASPSSPAAGLTRSRSGGGTAISPRLGAPPAGSLL